MEAKKEADDEETKETDMRDVEVDASANWKQQVRGVALLNLYSKSESL